MYSQELAFKYVRPCQGGWEPLIDGAWVAVRVCALLKELPGWPPQWRVSLYQCSGQGVYQIFYSEEEAVAMFDKIDHARSPEYFVKELGFEWNF